MLALLQGSGKWKASGGEKSKFGLAATQVLQLIDTLRQAGRLDSLQLLHFHLDHRWLISVILRQVCVNQPVFMLSSLQVRVNIQYFDVGGGLGVDYEGTRSQSDCSVNWRPE